MKTISILIASVLLSLPVLAEDVIEAQIRLITHDEQTTIGDCCSEFKKLYERVGKDISNILTMPKKVIQSGGREEMTVASDPPDNFFQSGIKITVTPTIKGEDIRFKAIGTIRLKQSPKSSQGLEIQEYTTGEFIVTGLAKNGGTVVIPFNNLHDIGLEGKTTMLLTLTKVTAE